MNKYTNYEIIEDINNSKELIKILKDESIKSNKFKEDFTDNINKKNNLLNMGLTLGLLVPLLTANISLSLVFFIPYGILRLKNEIMLMKFYNYNIVRELGIAVSLSNLDNLIEDLNAILESRKGMDIEESKINNLVINLSMDSKFYDDLIKIDKNFKPEKIITEKHKYSNNYISSHEYYNLVFDELFMDNTENKEEYNKIKKIKCNYLFDINNFKNI